MPPLPIGLLLSLIALPIFIADIPNFLVYFLGFIYFEVMSFRHHLKFICQNDIIISLIKWETFDKMKYKMTPSKEK